MIQSALVLITLALLFAYIVLLLLYRFFWNSIPTFSIPASKDSFQTFISIIIPCRNEENNIADLLDSILLQSYPIDLFEIIIVDDFSTDNTINIVERYENAAIKIISLKDYCTDGAINSYKKKAIEIGVAAAKGELIVTTDADCIVKKDWLKTISSFFEKHHPVMIVMPLVISHSSSFIQRFQSIDFMCLQGITGAAVFKNIHGMCNGANLAYSKKVFEELDGFKDINHIASGDDMMLMQKFSKKYSGGILYLKSEDVIVETIPTNTVREFLNQRIRWASKADKYQDKSLMPVLLIVYLLNLFTFVLLIDTLFFNNSYTMVVLIVLLSKTMVELFFLFPVAVFFNKQSSLWLFPFLQPFHILYTIIAGWLGKFGTYTWKERRVK